jgi:hypothetical protein
VRCFWYDLEQHHRGIDSLRLPREVAGAWKRRLRTKTTTVTRGDERVEVESERLGYLDTLATVRAFYLDLAQWGLDDPIRWGVWVAPCPISRKDPDQDRPAHCGPGQRLGNRPRHRQTTTTQPRRGTRILGMGAH